jgi:hypothetical protein
VSTPSATSPGPRRRQARPADEVPSITSAPEPLADDQARRMNRYFVQMGIRMACFLGALFLADGWLRWVLLVGAVVLPYSAVLFANAGRDRVTYDTSPVTPQGPAALLPGPASADPGEPGSTDDAGPGAPAGGGRVIDHVDDVDDHADDHTDDHTDDPDRSR